MTRVTRARSVDDTRGMKGWLMSNRRRLSDPCPRPRAIAALAVIWGLGYLTWRALSTLAGTPLWLSLPLLAAEAWSLVRLALFAATTWRHPADADAPPQDSTDETTSARTSEPTPVELLVPVAGATVEELGRTLVVAAANPPARVRVLDTAQHDDIETEARRHGADYEIHDLQFDLPVTTSTECAALVGRALADTEHGIVAWVNAGDVLTPGLLDLASRFDDPAIAVVQAATDYSNRDSLLHSTPDHDERAVLDRVVGPARSSYGVAPWHGSGSLLRVTAVAEAGGLSDGLGSTTGRTAVRLAQHGWRIEFCEQPSVRVTAPDTLDDYLTLVADEVTDQWAVLFTPDTPLLARRLPWRTRAALLATATRPLDGLARLTYLTVIAAVLLTGQLPIAASALGMILLWAPAWALRGAATISLARGTLRWGDPTRQSLRELGPSLRAILYPIIGHRSHPGLDSDGDGPRLRGVAALGRFGLVTAAAVAINGAIALRALTFVFPTMLRPFTDVGRAGALTAAVFAIIPLIEVLQVLVTRRQRRTHHRVGANLVASVDGATGRVLDLTPRGLGVELADPPDVGERVTIALMVPRLAGTFDDVELTAHVRHVSVPTEGRRARVGLELCDISADARDALVELCALSADQRDIARDQLHQISPEDFEVSRSSLGKKALATLNVVGLLTAGVVVMAGPASAGADPNDAKAPPAATAKILGRVSDAGGTPLEGMCVGSSSLDGLPTVTTDADGFFQFEKVIAGDYVLFAEQCDGNDRFARTYFPSAPTLNAAKPVTVIDDAMAGTFEIQMVPTGLAYGSVVNASGEPLSGICVNLVPTDGAGENLKVAITDEDGRFDGIVPAVPGTIVYTDCSSDPARVSQTWFPGTASANDAKPVEFGAGEKFDLGAVTMIDAARVSGSVRGADGEPIASVCVSAYDVVDGSWNYLGGSTSDEKGQYVVSAVVGPISLIFVDCGTGIDVATAWFGGAPPWTTPPPTIDLKPGDNDGYDQTMQAGGRIQGRLTDEDNAPVSGVCIAVHPRDLLLEKGDSNTAWWGSKIDEKGVWESPPLPAGDYLVHYVNCDENGSYQDLGRWIEEFHTDVFPTLPAADLRDSAVVTVKSGATTDSVDDSLMQASFVKGVVTTGSGDDEVAVGDVCVGTPDARSSAVTAGDGTWRMAMPPGKYTFTFTDCRPGRGLVQQSKTIELVSGKGSYLDANMEQSKPGAIAGRAVDSNGKPLVNACIVAYLPSNSIAMAKVADDGTWQIDEIGGGTYWLAIINCDDPFQPMTNPSTGEPIAATWWPAATANIANGAFPERDGAKLIEVSPGEVTAGIDFCFSECGTIEETTTTTPASTVPVSTIPVTTAPATTAAPTTTIPATTVPTTGPPTTGPATTAPTGPTTVATSVPPTTAAPTTAAPTTVPATLPATTAPVVPATTLPPDTTPTTTAPSGGPTTTTPIALVPTTSTPNNGTGSGRIIIDSTREDSQSTADPEDAGSATTRSRDEGNAGPTRRRVAASASDAGMGISADVAGESIETSRTPRELAARDFDDSGFFATVTEPVGRHLWVILAGASLLAFALVWLIGAKRRDEEEEDLPSAAI